MIELRHIAMLLAERKANTSNCKKRGVGFSAFKDAILSVSANQHSAELPCECVAGIHDPNVKHAERIGLADGVFLGCDVALTYAPCIDCASLLINVGIERVYIKQIKHVEGINLLKKNQIEVMNEWLTPQQRIQAAWLIKWGKTGYEGYL